ncbi:dihydroxyacetone phosphate acyltransferase [Pieris brassicae]|uniref:dihydroxyacetone phosphate acyltransferase n=1 Tax=Pieris brassicae TaxID=7116 RepID=UPI001E66145C|nr:dihydroxyacetone phosphate acyltransferase [Pieris brassicae]
MRDKIDFMDILQPRNTYFGIVKFMTRPWIPKKTMNLEREYFPQDIKNLVTKSAYLDSYLDAESARSNIVKQHLKKEVLKYIEEIAMDKRMHVIRWMGVFFLNVSFMMKTGIFVNETAVLELKKTMGDNPVLFLPTHRSYADFCLMTYLCYHYDIELPAVAAGMDFYTMAVVGQMMRETGAFYMRRTLAGAPLYSATLRQYVRTLVAHYGAPVEFFLEGTRSRSNKSLPPKYGMLAMSLVPYFAREVDDVTIVPVNISYDRIVEQALFAYEHLGVPKPKETTGGLIKALHTLNDHFGNIYINLGTPMSLKSFLGHSTLTSETLKPRDLQKLTDDQMRHVQRVADHVVTLQQDNAVVTITNLLCIVLMDSLYKGRVLGQNEVESQISWLIEVLQNLGASVFARDIKGNMERVLIVHRTMVKLDREKRLRLVSSALMNVTADVQKKMKGHILKAETMVNAVPLIKLQIYINPVLHYIVPPALIHLIVSRHNILKDELYSTYIEIRRLLRHEFFHIEENEQMTLDKALEYCIQNKLVLVNNNLFCDGLGDQSNDKLRYMLQWALLPALTTLLCCMDVMNECKECEHKRALKKIQERLEQKRSHPYCLSLEAAGNCLQGLVHSGVLVKHKMQQEIVYEAVPEAIENCQRLVSSILPKLTVDFYSNPVIIHQTQRARL